MNRFGHIILATVLLLLPGCTMKGCQKAPVASKPPEIKPDTTDVGKPQRFPEIVRMSIIYIEVPAGQASKSEEIWSYLDEEPVGADRLVSLGRNGIRVGLGRAKSMPDIIRVLKRMTGKALGRRLMVGRTGATHHVLMKRNQGVQTIFVINPDRSLSGMDIPAGDNVLSVVCTVDEDDAARMILTGRPQVRSTKIKTRFRNEPAGVTIVNKPVMFGFKDLLFQMPMKPGEFLVIGPGAAALRPSSVGQRFFMDKKQGVDFEIVMVLSPTAELLPEK